MALPHWLRECIQITEENQEPQDSGNVLNFPQGQTSARANDGGHSALDLVYQAAEVVGNLQDQARQTETRAQSLCRNAAERLRQAEKRMEAAESALYLAESRISSAEAKLSAAELRAKNAESRARELDHALSLIEEAIRTRLLGENQSAYCHRRAATA
ncbi:hypothetical protein ACFFWD_40030 [Bradyrhizobium erythrophlei]|uniref:hypothetical protein n=1 Tax=Bradyrhizobium erythrophlei TaxID=1437360 RepID=UPI0035EE8736